MGRARSTRRGRSFEPADDRHDGIVRVVAAQDELVVGVGELEARAQCQLIVRVETAYGAQQAHRRATRKFHTLSRKAQSPGGEKCACEMKQGGEQCKERTSERKLGHRLP